MRRYSYSVTINGTPYDFTRIADSSSFQYLTPLCSNDKKSGNGTASVVLKGGANATWYQSFMQALLSAQQNKVYGDCEVAILDNNTNKTIHRGWVNMDELSVSSASFPDQLLLASKDKMQMLDSKIHYNQLWENQSRVQIVSDLIDMMNAELGMNVPYLSSELSAVDTVDHFCVAEGREETYRSVIDTLLFEATGYVLWYDANADGFRIIEIPTTVDPLETYRVVKYRLENKLVTQSAVYANDGILLAYPTIVERPNTNVYNEDIDVSISDDNEVIGQTVPSGDYFPTDGDVKEIYQEYSVPDRAYIAKESRLENADLQLLYAKDVSYRLDSQPALSLAPALPNVNWDGVAHFYPDRARILFKNNNVGDSNVVAFTLTGTAVYIESLNKFTVPDNCTKPEEYTVKTITDATKAKKFADWYYNSKRYGCTMSKWAEPEGYSTLGEIVMVQHKDTGVQMPHVIVQITDSCAGGQSGTIRLKEVVAISLYGWQSIITQTVPQTSKPNVQKPEVSKWLSGTVLEGQTTARGVAGKVGDWYLNTDTFDLYQCILEGGSTTALWTWKGNIKGEDATLEGYTYAIEYGLSDSPTEFHFPDGNIGYTDDNYGAIDPDDNDDFEYAFLDYDWSANVNGWHKGLYVWQRLKVTDKDGNITYEDPTYAEDITISLINGCILGIVLTDSDGDGNTHTWEKNLASASGVVNVQFRLIARSYGSISDFETALSAGDGVTLVPYKNQTALTPFVIPAPTSKSFDSDSKTVTFVYDISFAQNLDYDSLVFNVSISDTYTKSDNLPWTVVSQTSETMNAVDITVYDVFGGIFTSDSDAEDYFTAEYGGLLEGYTYAFGHEGYADHLALKTYFGGAWLYMANLPNTFSLARVSAICGRAQKMVLSQIPQGTVTLSDFGYFNIVIANVVTARFIGSKQIQLQTDDNGNAGYIYGGDVDPAQPFKSRVGQMGFIIDTLGQMEASSAYFKNCEIDGASIISSLVFSNGAEINHPYFKTISTQGNDMAVQSLPSKTHWYTGDIDWLTVLATANEFTDFADSYINNTTAIDWGLRVTDPNHQIVSSGTTIGSASIIGGGSATLISSVQYKGTYTLSISIPSSYGTNIGVIYVNGNEVLTRINSNGSTTITLNKGDRVTCSANSSALLTISFSVKAVTVTLANNGYTNVGVYLHGTSPDTLYFYNTFNEYKASSVRWLFKDTYYTVLFDSNSHMDYAHLESLVTGYMSALNAGTYTATGSVTYNGTSCTVATISKDSANTGRLTIYDSVPNFYVLNMSANDFHNISGSVQILASKAGVETHAIYPEDTETYDIGEGGKQYRRIYCVNVVESSRRDLKTNIEPFTDDAVSILKTVDVSKYNLKCDMDLPQDEIVDYIGFIADDTDSRLAGKKHDKFNHINCIGVLIKAVQELSAEIENLKGGKK